jgi:hypothetical protein
MEFSENPDSIKFKEAIRKLDYRRITNLKWPFNYGASAMTFYARNDEIFRFVYPFYPLYSSYLFVHLE